MRIRRNSSSPLEQLAVQLISTFFEWISRFSVVLCVLFVRSVTISPKQLEFTVARHTSLIARQDLSVECTSCAPTFVLRSILMMKVEEKDKV